MRSLFKYITLVALLMMGNLTVSAANTNSKSKTGTFDQPDFAYPKNVVKNAEGELKKSMFSLGKGTDSYFTALRGAMQILIAENMISKDSVSRGLRLIENLSGQFGRYPGAGRVAVSISKLLEADVYKNIYQSNRWTYDNRTLPTDSVSENPFEWSRDIFAEKVYALVNESFDESSVYEARKLKVNEMSSILDNIEDAEKCGLTAYDFMLMKGIELLKIFSNSGSNTTIPFFSAKSGDITNVNLKCSELMQRLLDDALVSYGRDFPGAMLQWCVIQKTETMSDSEAIELLNIWSNRLYNSPWCAGILSRLYSLVLDLQTSSTGTDRKLTLPYRQMKEYLAKYPDAYGTSELDRDVAEIERKSVSVRFEPICVPGHSVQGTVVAKNVNDIYLLFIKVSDVSTGGTVRVSKLRNLPVAASVKVSGNAQSVPYQWTGTWNSPALQVGHYAVVPSSTPASNGIFTSIDDYQTASVLTVTGISMFVSRDLKDPAKDRIYVVDGQTMQPVAEATVNFYKPNHSGASRSLVMSKVTGRDGYVSGLKGSYTIEISRGADFWSGSYNSYGFKNETVSTLNGRVLTDLSIYHPGDSVGFVSVVYTQEGQKLSIASRRRVSAVLRDANYKSVDTLTLTTDLYGRVSGKFKLPEGGLLGTWGIDMVKEDGSRFGGRSFEVADYKAPTFFVAVENVKDSITPGEDIVIEGKVMTYSRMPVAGAKVNYTVRYLGYWWWTGNNNATYGDNTVSGPDGSFRVTLPTEGLIGTEYQKGRYELTVNATSPDGETQAAPATFFALGSAYNISCDMPDKVCLDETHKAFEVKVLDILGKPVRKKVVYKVETIEGDSVAGGVFESPVFDLSPSTIGVGKYKFKFRVDGESPSRTTEHTMVIWTSLQKTTPYKTPLWIPDEKIIVDKGKKKVNIQVGTGYKENWLFAMVVDSKGVKSRHWLFDNFAIRTLTIDAPEGDDRVRVYFRGMNEFEGETGMVTVIPEEQVRKLTVKAETFRDRLTPGSEERWRFSFGYDGDIPAAAAAMAVMSNKALDALSPFRWSLDPYSSLYWSYAGSLDSRDYYVNTKTFLLSKMNYKGAKPFVFPSWQTYGVGLYNPSMSALRIRSSGKLMAAPQRAEHSDVTVGDMMEENTVLYSAAETTSAKMAKAESVDEAEVVSADAGGVDGGADEDEVTLREIECPLAFFMPILTTDRKGGVDIDFKVPDFNTTWKFQIAGYDRELRGISMSLDAVSAKQVMVSLNAPRFLRTGDKTTLAANLYNNTAEVMPVGGRIVIFNPATGEVLKETEFNPLALEPAGSRVVTIDYAANPQVDVIGVRAYASAESFRDGEQTMVVVLPSSQPVVESRTFYIAPGTDEVSVNIPKIQDHSNVTLQYCDNPVWECVTALPDLTQPESDNVLSILYSVFGNAVSSGLVTRYPHIKESLQLLSAPTAGGDSTLVSNLSKNSELKTVALNNTPWVNNAESETMRMQRLVDLTDPKAANRKVEDMMDRLLSKQKADGGWSWCDGMKSSEFITTLVLDYLGKLKMMGFLPASADNAVRRAVKYCDNLWVERALNQKNRFAPISMLQYLYTRGQFNIEGAKDFNYLSGRTLSSIVKEWRNLDIYGKATAAMVAYRDDEKSLASDILESLRQLSTETSQQGLWWDNLSSGFSGMPKLMITARVLESWHQIAPAAEEIDKIRQWLVLSKQTEDWGDNRMLAEVIYAILSTGSDWTGTSESPMVFIGDELLTIPASSALTGSFTVNLNRNVSGKEIIVKKASSGPAWGGVINQYIAPAKSVKAEKIPQLSITKEILKVVETPGGTETTRADKLKVGDKVRVTLTIKASEDMDYVAVTDSRGACMEPTEQLSGYTCRGELWMYEETRQSATNLFIGFLPKGTHIITYDCYVDRKGEYSVGIATAQSQYAPLMTAHSAGTVLTVE